MPVSPGEALQEERVPQIFLEGVEIRPLSAGEDEYAQAEKHYRLPTLTTVSWSLVNEILAPERAELSAFEPLPRGRELEVREEVAEMLRPFRWVGYQLERAAAEQGVTLKPFDLDILTKKVFESRFLPASSVKALAQRVASDAGEARQFAEGLVSHWNNLTGKELSDLRKEHKGKLEGAW